jgi:hypothetical protein
MSSSYFVTGATGFIGRHLVERLLEREGTINLLVREGSRARLEELLSRWEAEDGHALAHDVPGNRRAAPKPKKKQRRRYAKPAATGTYAYESAPRSDAAEAEGGEETLGRGRRGAVPDVLTGGTEAHHLAEVRGGDNALFAAALRAEHVTDQ